MCVLFLAGALFCKVGFGQTPYTLTVEATTPVAAAGTVYRFYVDMTDPSDRMSAVFGNDQAPLEINTPGGVFNSPYNSSWSASGINPAFLPIFPDMADDTYATIGLDGPASSSGLAGAADPSLVEDSAQAEGPNGQCCDPDGSDFAGTLNCISQGHVVYPLDGCVEDPDCSNYDPSAGCLPISAISAYFITDGATSLIANTSTGSSYYVLNTAANGLPDANMRVLVLQLTTSGSISGSS